MITKERLQELIEKEALIFYILNNSVALLRLNNSYGISVEEYNKEHNCKPQFYHSGYVFQNICDADKIFETEEDAKWELEMTATRTETLKLPTWEEFIKERDMEEFGFYSKYHKYTTLKVISDKYLAVEDNWERYYTGELTKENYIEACNLAKRLFLGEEV